LDQVIRFCQTFSLYKIKHVSEVSSHAQAFPDQPLQALCMILTS
jgi:hypothetical protein